MLPKLNDALLLRVFESLDSSDLAVLSLVDRRFSACTSQQLFSSMCIGGGEVFPSDMLLYRRLGYRVRRIEVGGFGQSLESSVATLLTARDYFPYCETLSCRAETADQLQKLVQVLDSFVKPVKLRVVLRNGVSLAPIAPSLSQLRSLEMYTDGDTISLRQLRSLSSANLKAFGTNAHIITKDLIDTILAQFPGLEQLKIVHGLEGAQHTLLHYLVKQGIVVHLGRISHGTHVAGDFTFWPRVAYDTRFQKPEGVSIYNHLQLMDDSLRRLLKVGGFWWPSRDIRKAVVLCNNTERFSALPLESGARRRPGADHRLPLRH